MKKILSNALVSVVFAVAAQSAMAKGDATAGAEKSAVCAACHAVDGNSPVGTFPKLAGLGERYLLKQMHDIREWDRETDAAKKETTGRAVPEMTGQIAGLSDQDLADIAAYYAAQTTQLSGAQKIEVKVNSGILVDALELGERVYRGGNREKGVPACTGCHAPDGQGNAPAGYPRLSGQHPEYIEKQLLAFRGGERTNDGDQMIMRSIADRMSDAEIKAVANFIGGLH
jgi:cytochrome c553